MYKLDCIVMTSPKALVHQCWIEMTSPPPSAPLPTISPVPGGQFMRKH